MLSTIIGNKRAVRRLKRARYQFQTGKPPNLAIIGPASTGKTLMARSYAHKLAPFLELQPQAIESLGWLHDKLLPMRDKPCIVFIDEVHNLKKPIVQGLLKAVEPNDRILETEEGYKYDTSKISWVIATTERGLLFDAFDTRFSKVQLRHYSRGEIAQIVKLSYGSFSDAACKMIAHYCGLVPREALLFAEEVLTEWRIQNDSDTVDPDNSGDMLPNTPRISEIMKYVANDSGIDEHGMTFKRLSILVELGNGPIASTRLAGCVQVKKQELDRFILPPLLAKTPDRQPYLSVCSKGYYITPVGLRELDLRGIDNLSHHAIPQSLWRKYPDLFS